MPPRSAFSCHRRRAALGLLAVLCMPARPGALAQARTPRRIGILWITNEDTVKLLRDAIEAGLRDHGYVPGRDVVLEERYGRSDPARLPALADELLALKPDVILGVEITARALIAKTTSIPIVLLTSTNPVAAGLAQSLARPGGNVTGLSSSFDETIAKQVEVLTELSPRMTRIALLLDSTTTPSTRARFEEAVRKAARAKGLTAIAIAMGSASELDRAFDEMKAQRAEGLIVPQSGIANQYRREIADKARQVALPAVSAGGTQHAELGMLMTYGVNFQHSYRYAATYVDRILKGAKPGDLPIEQYGRYELVINLKTARAMGLKLPQSLLLRADRVIE